MIIYKAIDYSENLLHAVNALLPQLTSKKAEISAALLSDIIHSQNSSLFLAKENDEILGMLTLLTIHIPTGIRCIVEDVVVDAKLRGKGAGRSLMEAAIQKAKNMGCDNINLTSSPHREAANALYKKLGFEIRETNVYRKILK